MTNYSLSHFLIVPVQRIWLQGHPEWSLGGSPLCFRRGFGEVLRSGNRLARVHWLLTITLIVDVEGGGKEARLLQNAGLALLSRLCLFWLAASTRKEHDRRAVDQF